MERLQPGSSTMMTGKRNPPAKMRRHMRPRQLAGIRTELYWMPFSRMRGFVFGPFYSCFRLRKGGFTFPDIVPDCTVVSERLPFLIICVTGFALWRQHVFDPVLDVDQAGFSGPIAFGLTDNVKFGAEPVDRFADQFVGGYTMRNTAFTIGKLFQRPHDIGTAFRIVTVLKNIVYTPVTPHSGHIMMRNMAMKQEIACQTLTQSGTAFGLKVHHFRGTDYFYVHAVGGGADHGIFNRAVVGCGDQVFNLNFPLRRPGPADRSSMRMVRMEHLPAAVNQTKFRRVP